MSKQSRSEYYASLKENEEELEKDGRADDLPETVQQEALDYMAEQKRQEEEKAKEEAKKEDVTPGNTEQTPAEDPAGNNPPAPKPDETKKRQSKPKEKSYKGLIPKDYNRTTEGSKYLQIKVPDETHIEIVKRTVSHKGANKRTFVMLAVDAFLEMKESLYDALIDAANERKVTVGSILNEVLAKQLKEGGLVEEEAGEES
jgi:hypothetical protein